MPTQMKTLTMAVKKPTSACGVSFKQKSPTIILLNFYFFLVSHCDKSMGPIYKISKFLHHHKSCTKEGINKMNFRKQNKFRHIKIKQKKERFWSLPKCFL